MFTASLAFSLHLGVTASNAIHPVLGVEQDGWMAGGYFNSYGEVSLFAGRRFGDQFWLEAGAVTGYRYPVFARVGVDVVDRVSLWAAPAVSDRGDTGAVVGVEVKVWH